MSSSLTLLPHPASNQRLCSGIKKGFPVSAPILFLSLWPLSCPPPPQSQTEKLDSPEGAILLLEAEKRAGTCICSQHKWKQHMIQFHLKKISSPHLQLYHLSPESFDLSTAVKQSSSVWGIKCSLLTCFLFSDFCGLVHLSSFSLLSAPLISRGGKKPFYFNIPRTSDSWSVRASGTLVTLPRC